MNLPSDKYIREQIGTLDHISPPTNWNPDNTWRRIAKTKLWYRRKTAVILSLVPILLLTAFFFWPTTPVQIDTIYLSEISVYGVPNKTSPLPLNSDVVVKELNDSVEDLQLAGSHAPVKTETNMVTVPPKPSSPTKENVPVHTSINGNDTLGANNLAQETQEDSVHIRVLDVSSVKASSTSPIISISLHADKEKPAPKKVQRSIIKLKSDYRYSTSKKTYSLQINR